MIIPSAKIENKLINQGYKNIVGIDEVGRGAIAGPIVAAAVIMPAYAKASAGKPIKKKIVRLQNVRDSKQLTKNQREKLFDRLICNCLSWSVGIVHQDMIDEIGIQQANTLAMERALEKLYLTLKPDYLLVDYIKLENCKLPQQSIVGGDSRVYLIAAASILAKVVRDAILAAESNKHPYYGFEKHVGYGTTHHIKMIKKHGPCVLHRKSFEPIKSLML